jgi:chromate transporter
MTTSPSDRSRPAASLVAEPARGGALEVFRVTFALGLTSFGGPIAHLGYFEQAYVRKRGWLSAEEYAGLLALSQLLPGPTSSKVSFLVGLRRAGWLGALAAWLGFTLPSAVAMYAFARIAPSMQGPALSAVVHGLKLVAVAVVAQAVWSMAQRLCPDRERTAIALTAAVLLLAIGGVSMQVTALMVGAAGGALLCRGVPVTSALPPIPISMRAGAVALAALLILLIALPLAGRAAPHSLWDLAGIFYRAGALVFGGGHVVLPLLRAALVPHRWLTDNSFLTGYGAAQALPGPLFTFAAYLGAVVAPAGEAPLWSFVALVFVFLPGILIALAGLPLWAWLGHRPTARAALAGINAAVVGVLGAALYDPIWVSAVANGRDVAIALVGFLLLDRWRVPPLTVVVFCTTAALLTSVIRI